ncbi:alpha/beta hydrolase [Petroclostridium xylanilyticum]|uniref:alpha/beta hydrolase n=1 Tax=Petroclostridium xylanilyticum TaxID=1792311 RepID=UPI000B9907FC|nr:alpha/beta fold hydrolase [Petroclostridium xylanilyticum]
MPERLDIKNRRAAIGCLLIHGFGGNVDEIRPLADFLTEQGYRVECPSLKGHTGKREDMKRCTYWDWIASAQEGYNKLQEKCDTLYLVGFSMGGLIAFQLVLNNRVDAVVTLNTPIYYWDLKRVIINIIEDLKVRKLNNIRRYIASFRSLPFNALLNFRLLLSRTKPILEEIKCPVFTVQALEDDTVRKSSATYIYGHIGSQCKKLEFYEESGHLILWSKAADRVIEDVSDFLEQIEKGKMESELDGECWLISKNRYRDMK